MGIGNNTPMHFLVLDFFKNNNKNSLVLKKSNVTQLSKRIYLKSIKENCEARKLSAKKWAEMIASFSVPTRKDGQRSACNSVL